MGFECYGEDLVDFSNRDDRNDDSLVAGDWRRPGTGGAPSPLRPAQRSGIGPATLHLGARRASLAQERSRAREIVSVAKERIFSTFDDVRFGRKINVETLWPLVSSITASVERHSGAIMGVTRIKERHEYTYMHSVAVCGLMINLARHMKLDPTLHHAIGMAGLLHDIGKARVPPSLLDKPGALTPDEMAVMHKHCEFGHDMLINNDEKLPDIVLDVVLHHHERLDGSGYPDAKAGSNVSQYARMTAICDTYDALTSDRPYKEAWSPAEAIEWMVEQTNLLDQEILSVFSGMIGIFPVGSMVRLQSNRLAVVLDNPEADPATPPVCPFFCIMTKQSLPWRVSPPGVDPIIGVESPARWRLANWPDMRRGILAQFPGGV